MNRRVDEGLQYEADDRSRSQDERCVIRTPGCVAAEGTREGEEDGRCHQGEQCIGQVGPEMLRRDGEQSAFRCAPQLDLSQIGGSERACRANGRKGDPATFLRSGLRLPISKAQKTVLTHSGTQTIG